MQKTNKHKTHHQLYLSFQRTDRKGAKVTYKHFGMDLMVNERINLGNYLGAFEQKRAPKDGRFIHFVTGSTKLQHKY